MNWKIAFVCLVAIFALASARIQKFDILKLQFDQLVAKYQRNYATAEIYNQRFQIFVENMKRIEQISKMDPSATYGMNKFFDVSKEEFDATSKGFKKASSPLDLAVSCLSKGVTLEKMEVRDLPTSFDWRTKNVVTPVKNQGECGSCWAFSTTGNIESQYAIKTGQLVSLSEQELVDCSKGCANEPPYGKVCNNGCGGGWQWIAFTDLMSNGGLETEANYPYQGVDEDCHFVKSKVAVSIMNYTCLTHPNVSGGADEDVMAQYLVDHGPISIALNAEWLQFYKGGISNPASCDGSSLDHAVLIVGYGQQSSQLGSVEKFWIVKNSWAESWGEKGYFRIARGKNCCGLANAVSSANL